MKFKLFCSMLSCACALLVSASAAHGQAAFPAGPIRMIVPFAAGGPSDVVARVLSRKLSEELGVPVVIDSKPGAAGNIASAALAKSRPDGQTLILATVGTHAINASLYDHLPFDTLKDFDAIARVASAPIVLVANPAINTKTVKEFIELAKAKPGTLSYASPGSGTPQHLGGELFATLTKTPLLHVPYKGGAPALNDLLGGQVSAAFVSVPAALPYIRDGKLNALGVTTAKRSAVVPDIVTIAEAGVPGYEVDNWYGVFAPAGTPRAIVLKLNAQINKAMAAPDVRKTLVDQGFEVLSSSADDFNAFHKREIEKWSKLVKLSGAKAD